MSVVPSSETMTEAEKLVDDIADYFAGKGFNYDRSGLVLYLCGVFHAAKQQGREQK